MLDISAVHATSHYYYDVYAKYARVATRPDSTALFNLLDDCWFCPCKGDGQSSSSHTADSAQTSGHWKLI
jgi:hypothetical protein